MAWVRGIRSPPECGGVRKSVSRPSSRNELSKKQKRRVELTIEVDLHPRFRDHPRGPCFTMLDLSLAGSDQRHFLLSLIVFFSSFLFPSVYLCEPKICLPGLHILLLRVVLALVVPHEEVTPAGSTQILTQKDTETGNMTGNGGRMNGTECTTTGDVGGAGVHRLTKVCPLLPHVLVFLNFSLAGRKRRRSMSPYDRERYDPRPRYNDDYGLNTLFLILCISCGSYRLFLRHALSLWLLNLSTSLLWCLRSIPESST